MNRSGSVWLRSEKTNVLVVGLIGKPVVRSMPGDAVDNGRVLGLQRESPTPTNSHATSVCRPGNLC
jgi:hypothetical protein